MKNKKLYLLIVTGLFLIAIINAQTNWGTNTLDDPDPANANSSALGTGHNVSGQYSFTSGRNNNVSGTYSTAFGLSNKVSSIYSTAFGLNNEVTRPFSFAFGRHTKASGINSFVLGKGTTTGLPLENSNNYSFLVGFKHNEPGLFVSRNTQGPMVGISTDSPQSRLDIRLGDKQDIRIQSEVPNTYGGISFRHSNGSENWRIRAFSNFTGGYGNILSIVSPQKHDFWISAGKTMIGDWFDFDPCSDCNEYELFVKKGIRTQKVKVDLAAGVWADYVFEKDYDLKSLEEVEAFINENGHLPNVLSAEEVKNEGLNLGEMDAKLLEKIEELTLYVIELKKEINELKARTNENQE